MKCFQGIAWGISNKTLLTLYKTLIRSRLDYGSFLFTNASQSNLKYLDSIQYKALSIVLGAPKGTSLYSILAETGETSLTIRREILLEKFLLRIKSNPNNCTAECLNNKLYHNLNLKYTSTDNISINNRISTFTPEIKLTTNNFKSIFYIEPWTPPLQNITTDLSNIKIDTNSSKLENNNFEKFFKETYPDATQIFIDASNKDKNSVAIFIPSLLKWYSFQILLIDNIFTLEAHALLKALEITQNENIYPALIFSDCKTLLTHIKYPSYILHTKIPNPILINTIRNLIKPKHTVQWIPGHSQIIKHIIADNIATHIIPTESINNTYIEIEDAYRKITSHYRDIWFEEWISKKGNSEYCENNKPKHFLKTHFVSFSNRQLEIIGNRIRLCSNNLNSYLSKIGKDTDPLCDRCNKIETTTHFLSECKKHSKLIDNLKFTIKTNNILSHLPEILSNYQLLYQISSYIKENKINF